jgi:hypothetical protein
MPFGYGTLASEQNQEEQRDEGHEETPSTDVLPQVLGTCLSDCKRGDHPISLTFRAQGAGSPSTQGGSASCTWGYRALSVSRRHQSPTGDWSHGGPEGLLVPYAFAAMADLNSPSDPGYRSPEEAALAGWELGAKARILRTEVISADMVEVIVDTDPSHPVRVHCQLEDGLWRNRGDIVE